jgi:hypothetical protein
MAPGHVNSHNTTSQFVLGPRCIGRAISTVKAPIVLSGYRSCEALLNSHVKLIRHA